MKKPLVPSDEDLSKAARTLPPPEGACIAPDRLTAFYAGALDETESEAIRDHLSACAACVAAATEARRFVEAMSGWGSQAAARRRWWLAAAAAAAVALGFLSYRSVGPPPENPAARWHGVPIAKAPYPLLDPEDGLLWRGGDPREVSAPGMLEPGMAAYTAGDLPEAARLLAGAVGEAPRHEVSRFYLGVTLLLLDRPREALVHLESASAGRASPLRDEARWYLALACLKSGHEARGE